MSKPMDNEPTPIVDGIINDAGTPNAKAIYIRHARNLERRMREAERLLEHSLGHCGRSFTAQNIEAHLEAARMEEMSIDPILELIKERNAVEEKLSVVTKERDELHAMHNRNSETYNELLELCGKLRKERDEALEWSKAGKESASIASAEIVQLPGYLMESIEEVEWFEKHCGGRTNLTHIKQWRKAARMEDVR